VREHIAVAPVREREQKRADCDRAVTEREEKRRER
jgi:hypothetical protein